MLIRSVQGFLELYIIIIIMMMRMISISWRLGVGFKNSACIRLTLGKISHLSVISQYIFQPNGGEFWGLDTGQTGQMSLDISALQQTKITMDYTPENSHGT